MVGSGRMHSWISGKLLTARSILDEPHSPWSVSLSKNRTVDKRPVCSAVIVVCRVPESTEVYISKRIEDVATLGKSLSTLCQSVNDILIPSARATTSALGANFEGLIIFSLRQTSVSFSSSISR